MLSAPGIREDVISLEEATETGARWSQQLDAAAADANQTGALLDDTALDISGRCWPLERVQQLLPVFARIVPSVRTLKLHDIIASLQTEEGLAVLEFFGNVFQNAPNLETVDLSSNATGSRGAAALMPLFNTPRVKSWNLSTLGLSGDDAQTLRTLWSKSSVLESLWLGQNQMDVAGALHIGALIASLPNLRGFSYRGNRPLRAGTQHICNGLAALPHPERLVKLDLQDSHLGSGDDDEDGIGALCQLLGQAVNVNYLNLQDCELEVPGLRAVLAALQTSTPPIEHLELGGNGEIGAEGVAVLIQFLTTNNNPTAAAVRILDFSSNVLGDDGVQLLVPCLVASQCCPNLHTLKLDDNEIEKEGAAALIENRIPSLTTLSLTFNTDLTAGAARRLQAMYGTVHVSDDLEETDNKEEEESDSEEDNAEVEDLGAALTDAQI